MSINNQEILAIIILGGFLGVAFVSFLVFISYRYAKKQAWFQKEIANLKTGFEQSIAKAQLDMQEETLSAIADKLHDDVKNNLNAIKLILMTAARTADENTKATLQEVSTELGKVIDEIRLTSHSLKTDRITDIGLAEAIEYEIYLLKKQRGIEIQLEKESAPDNTKIDEKNTVYLFRMFQETMGNVLTHSKASNVKVRLLYPAKNKLELCVIDNGVGFNVNEGRKKTSGSDGIGLSGLYKRAYQIGAELNIQSKIGQGTTVKIELPLAS
jgi:two-component system, NarL family, sensor kinase